MRALGTMGWVGLLGWLASASAAPRGVDVAVRGWTADGKRFVYQPPSSGIGEENDMGTDGAASFGVVVDARTGLELQKFLVDVEGTPLPKEKVELAKLPGKAAWKAFLKEQSPTCALVRQSSDGAATLDVHVSGKRMSGKWGKQAFSFGADYAEGSEVEDRQVVLGFVVVRGDKKISVGSWGAKVGPGESLSGSVRACFSPDSRRVAFIVRRAPSMMRDIGEATVIIGPAVSPRIQLVADKSVLVEAATQIGAIVDGAGFTSASSKASNETTPRAATVIYAAKGFEADAAKIAALIPGGATVGVLDWKAPADIVIGIGASALAKSPPR